MRRADSHFRVGDFVKQTAVRREKRDEDEQGSADEIEKKMNDRRLLSFFVRA